MIRRATIFGLMALLMLALLVAATHPPAQPAAATTTTQDLAARYTFKSIYLTYDTLTDIHYTFKQRSFGASFQSFGEPEAVRLLDGFIKQYGGVRYADSVAFLQLNLQEKQAAFMPKGVRGTVTTLQWTPEQVQKVALLVHNYLLNNASAALITDKLHTQPISAAFADVKRVQSNPFVSPQMRLALNKTFQKYVADQASALRALRTYDMSLAREIESFVELIAKQDDVWGPDMKAGASSKYEMTQHTPDGGSDMAMFDCDTIYSDGTFVTFPEGVTGTTSTTETTATSATSTY